MKLNKQNLAIYILLSILALNTYAQTEETYLFPINPSQTNYLAGTMGELRSSHFHAGIDIKTGGKEGLEVLSTKSGYISRIKISTGGYGHALYVLHPDGNTSVYAHMKSFAPEVEAYVKEAQYNQQTYEIELFPEAGQFSFKRGESLGKSGNTGGSTGPHLHFEIRDPYQKVLNPLHYGFSEIHDNIAPIVQKLALKPKSTKSRIFDQAERVIIPLTRNGYNYVAKDTISAYGPIGIELLGHDKLNGAANKNGISIIEVKVNDQLYYSQNIDNMSFSTQKHIVVHYPYDVKVNEGSRYHRLYIADGNELDFYKPTSDQGWLTIEEDSLYHIDISMFDPYENNSHLKFIVKGDAPDTVLYKTTDFELDKIDYLIQDNILKVFLETECLKQNNTELSLKLPGEIVGIEPSYFLENTAVYLWDLSKGLPESVLSCSPGLHITETQINPSVEYSIDKEYMKVNFHSYSLFDTAYVTTSYEFENQDSLEFFSIDPNTYPLKGSIDVILSPKLNYNQEKSAVYATDDTGDFSFMGGSWSDQQLTFSTRSLGSFTILADNTPPSINRIANKLQFIIKDDLSGIKDFTAYLDGEWILLKYEPKSDLIWVEWPDKPDFKKTGEMVITVQDQAGNNNSLKINLN